MNIDMNILYWLQGLHCPWLDHVMLFLTSLGKGLTVWILLGLGMLIFKKTRKCGILVLISALLCDLLCEEVLKEAFHRIRPCNVDIMVDMLVRRPTNYSFPSGHAYHSFVCAMMIRMFFKNPGRLALILASLISVSRAYLFVHYPSDILAGAVFGIISALIIFYTSEFIHTRVKQLKSKIL